MSEETQEKTRPEDKGEVTAAHVYRAIADIAGELAKTGISKDQQNTHQKYKFRGIDDVYNSLAPLLAKHRLVILPRVCDRNVHERDRIDERDGTVRGVTFYVTLRVEFEFVSAIDGSKHTVSTFGESMDTGDKATNKAMSAAYKYACLQTFCIPTEGDNDADGVTHTVGHKKQDNRTAERASPQNTDPQKTIENWLTNTVPTMLSRMSSAEDITRWVQSEKIQEALAKLNPQQVQRLDLLVKGREMSLHAPEGPAP